MSHETTPGRPEDPSVSSAAGGAGLDRADQSTAPGIEPGSRADAAAPARKRDKTHFLYIAVIAAVIIGAVMGLVLPEQAKAMKPLGTGFIALIKMIIAPVIFCTIVLGVGSIARAATVGRVGGAALVYFLVMSTFALAIGLVVGNWIHPGDGLDVSGAHYTVPESDQHAEGTVGFILGIIPKTLLASLTGESILQTLFVALLVGFAIQQIGAPAQPLLDLITIIQRVVFRILTMIMWLAPIGAFGAMAAVVGATGAKAITSMLLLMVAFYITCILFIVVILGTLLKVVTGLNVFKLMRYLAKEYLLIFSTSSSEVALPRLIAKMEHAGVSKPVVGVVVPTGYSFNLDGTAIYLTMASIYISHALGKPMDFGQQIGLLVFMIIASKGAAGVTGAGIATLAGGLQSHRPDLVDGVGLILGIDRFMSEGRALTNFSGNAVATLIMGRWAKEMDVDRARAVLDKKIPFDEATLVH
ncbi:cation:dicarboxylate symporter family transporter [Falsarthrobacter nasiphocae]|uniref:Aerobic C4-dicarboxylate transport protein n=1 Tax=Falsarthrobacter nasiphocae TaxID=189863 RepID=A0AAE3YFS3_9MICC|nr:cation:dicarboxylase symporter family transporter [Falsarthrobacter nasiphocae]MDR6891380.1 aerobic C4-dicarboxylate transport protein [Falsarthrobacter nasiphocae]